MKSETFKIRVRLYENGARFTLSDLEHAMGFDFCIAEYEEESNVSLVDLAYREFDVVVTADLPAKVPCVAVDAPANVAGMISASAA